MAGAVIYDKWDKNQKKRETEKRQKKELEKQKAAQEQANPLRKNFANRADIYMSGALNGLTKMFAIPDTGNKGYEYITSWVDSNNIFWIKLIYLRIPNAPEIAVSTLEQMRKLLDNNFQEVLEKNVDFRNDWSARVFKIEESDSKIAVDVIFVDCPKAGEAVKQLDDSGVNDANNIPKDPDFGG